MAQYMKTDCGGDITDEDVVKDADAIMFAVKLLLLRILFAINLFRYIFLLKLLKSIFLGIPVFVHEQSQDTTSACITWFLYLIAKNPEHQVKTVLTWHWNNIFVPYTW